MDDSLVSLGVDSFAVDQRCAVIHVFKNKFRDLVRPVCDDHKVFAARESFDHVVYQERKGKDAKQGKQPGLRPENEERSDTDHDIHEKQRTAYIHLEMLFNNHCDDVRTARGRIRMEYDSLAYSHKENCTAKFKEGLRRHRSFQWHQQLEEVNDTGKNERADYSSEAHALSEEYETYNKQKHVESSKPHAYTRSRKFCQNDAYAAHSAHDESVRHHEKRVANSHQQRTEQYIKIVSDFDLFSHYKYLFSWILYLQTVYCLRS